MKDIKKRNLDIAKCVRCGTCRSVCPTFAVVLREAASPRGKVAIANAYVGGEVNISDAFLKHVSECVLCGACEEVCSNDVPVTDIIMAARAAGVKERGLPFAASAIMKGLRKPDAMMSKALKVASVFQGLLFKNVPEESGIRRRFRLPFVDKDRLLPPLAKRFFLDTLKKGEKEKSIKGPVFLSKSAESNIRVGFFAGCLINYVMPNIGMSAIDVLNKAGADVLIPLDQVCCGVPALGMGDVEDARSLALKNLEIFEGLHLDFITTACATCGDGLKRLFKDLLVDDEDDTLRQRVDLFSGKVRDITELLVNELEIGKMIKGSDTQRARRVVTYHDPCHLRRKQGIKEEPRGLLEMAGLTIKEMGHPCRCCGLGGSFNVTNYDFSMEIAKNKAEDIKATGADVAATACPGCILQLRDGLHKLNGKINVTHVVELLAESLKERT